MNKPKLTKAERSAIASAAQKKRRAKEKAKVPEIAPGLSGTPINQEKLGVAEVPAVEELVADFKDRL